MLLYLLPLFAIGIIYGYCRYFRKDARADKVFYFRLMLLHNLSPLDYLRLPSFNEMLTDGKELKIENYLPEYKTLQV